MNQRIPEGYSYTSLANWDLRNKPSMPKYFYTFEFEENFDTEAWITFGTPFQPLCLLFFALYLILLVPLKNYMKTRAPMKLRKTLMAWNTVLALFSAVAALRIIPDLLFTFQHYGFKATYCNAGVTRENRICVLWMILVVVSKALELFDTLFVVLRKQKLTFLHWFHHSTVVVWSWYAAGDMVAMGRWFICMNLVVHCFMYAYYAARTIKIPVPKFVAASITTAQITQMVVGFFISLLAFRAYFAGEECDITGRVVAMSFALYTAYFVLFVNFFYRTYVVMYLKARLKEE